MRLKKIPEKFRGNPQRERMAFQPDRNQWLEPRGELLRVDDVADDAQTLVPLRYVIILFQRLERLSLICIAKLVKKILIKSSNCYCIF